MELFLATSKGFVTAVHNNDQWQVEQRGLDGRTVTTVIAREGVILAGTQDGLFRSDDRGETWREQSNGLSQRHVRWLAFHPGQSDFELAGTEPAAIFISQDGAETWQERPEVAQLRDEHGWWLPYSPEAGCVRGFAVHGDRLYAAVEVGGVLRSDDRGQTWRLAQGSDGRPQFGRPGEKRVHPDVHSIEVHPSSPDLVLAPTGGGFYRSQDGGNIWEPLYDNCYVRAVWVDPDNAQQMVLGPAENASGRNGRIEETRDGGQTWQPLTEPQPRNMVERFYQAGSSLFAVTSRGQLWQTPLHDWRWQPILDDISDVNDVTTMAG